MGSLPSAAASGPTTGARKGPYESFTFDLASRKPDKTVDIGCNGVSVSLDAQARILQASAYHPKHGIILAIPFEQFDGNKFYDASYVRDYRTRMLCCIQQNRPGFGLDFGLQNPIVTIHLSRPNTAHYHFSLDHGVTLSIATAVNDHGIIEQRATVTNASSRPARVPLAYDMSISISRASYGQLTEGGPLQLPRAHNILQVTTPTTVQILNPELGAQLLANLAIDNQPARFGSLIEQETLDVPLHVRTQTMLSMLPQTTCRVHATFQLFSNLDTACTSSTGIASCQHAANETETPPWKDSHLVTTYILRRNVDYILANCTIPLDNDAVAIVPDHVALPLGWNRDNFWQMQLLYETYASIDKLVHSMYVKQYKEQIKYIAQRHLNWVFKVAQRPVGFYHRSYLVNGFPKDRPIFQLDQQCYPLLELCSFLNYFPEETLFVRDMVMSDAVREVLALLQSTQNDSNGLWPTEETPADDAVVYPYHFSSHVLLWRTFSSLSRLSATLSGGIKPDAHQMSTIATTIKQLTLQAFTFKHPNGRTIFAYTIDGHNRCHFYHDANDMPTLFAKDWGFVSTSDEIQIWKDTMAFGLSPANTQGYCDSGPYSGLGSMHSPGAWTLGYFQELKYAAWSNDRQAMQSVWKRILAAMQWDGTFSEAVSPQTADCTSKAWFSWPGAMMGSLLIQFKASKQEAVLIDVLPPDHSTLGHLIAEQRRRQDG